MQKFEPIALHTGPHVTWLNAAGAALIMLLLAPRATAAWPALPDVNLANYRVSDFADDELDVPYMLKHFARVAGSVVETGPNKGFLNIAVNREPVDNQPYNARIQEMNVALSYFYATDRPWNPYYRHPGVKVRLEAMLEFWCNMQNPTTGYFAEYSATNYSLAPTGFGVLAMSRTLERLSGAGAPPFDTVILDRTFACQRKAIMALLTNNQSFLWGKDYSNQWTGVLRAATAYMKLKPDPEMEAALIAGATRANADFQSPTGFLYEQGGPDFGYSTVNVQNVRLALPLLLNKPDALAPVLEQQRLYANWLNYNLVYQPGSAADFFTNAGVNTRTSHALQLPAARPVSQFSVPERGFSETVDERSARLAAQRASLQAGWPNVPGLTVPSAYSYNPGTLFQPSSGWVEWAPTKAQRDRAIGQFPYLREKNFTQLLYDARGDFSYLFVRRAPFYAILNAGKIRVPGRQVYGLGLLWSESGGMFAQSVAATPWVWGTRKAGESTVIETKNTPATFRSADTAAMKQGGMQSLPGGRMSVAYTIDDVTKKVSFNADTIVVETTRPNAGFVELVPLITMTGDQISQQNGRLTIVRGTTTLRVDVEPATAQMTLEPPSVLAANRANYQRRLLTLSGQGTLKYTIQLTSP